MSDDFAPMMGYDMNAFQQNGYTSVQYGNDRSLHVKFYPKVVYIPPRPGETEGREETQIYCRIQAPGDRLSIHDQPVREKDKARFRAQWEMYTRGAEAAQSGTPLEELRTLAYDEEQRLRYFGVHSLEQLANLSDGQMSGLGLGARELRDRARLRLREKAGAASVETFKAIQDENQALKQMLADQQAQIDAILASTDPKKKKDKE